MKKKILIISSSPRKQGNSDLLCDEFARGAVETGNEVNKIFLKERNINYCVGCGYCVNHKGVCSQKDDMGEIREQMLKSDTIVFATPIYFYTMAGQMKTLIDRICFFYTELKNKEFYYIMTSADGDKSAMQRAEVEFGGLMDCLDNPKEKGIIYGVGAWQKGDIVGTKAMKEAYEMGKNV